MALQRTVFEVQYPHGPVRLNFVGWIQPHEAPCLRGMTILSQTHEQRDREDGEWTTSTLTPKG